MDQTWGASIDIFLPDSKGNGIKPGTVQIDATPCAACRKSRLMAITSHKSCQAGLPGQSTIGAQLILPKEAESNPERFKTTIVHKRWSGSDLRVFGSSPILCKQATDEIQESMRASTRAGAPSAPAMGIGITHASKRDPQTRSRCARFSTIRTPASSSA